MAGVFGVIISGVQTLWLEQQLMAEVEWTQSVVLFTFAYALRLAIQEVGSETAPPPSLRRLGLLSGDACHVSPS